MYGASQNINFCQSGAQLISGCMYLFSMKVTRVAFCQASWISSASIKTVPSHLIRLLNISIQDQNTHKSN